MNYFVRSMSMELSYFALSLDSDEVQTYFTSFPLSVGGYNDGDKGYCDNSLRH